jgi:outer membrane protein assembly factor BamB
MTINDKNNPDNEYTSCPHCGGRHKASARFCTKTGKALVVIPSEIMPEKAEIGEIFVREEHVSPPPVKEIPPAKTEPDKALPVLETAPPKKIISLPAPPASLAADVHQILETAGKATAAPLKLKKPEKEKPKETVVSPVPPKTKPAMEAENDQSTVEMNLKRCTNCGTPFSKPDAKFCIACGVRVPVFDSSLEPLPTFFIVDKKDEEKTEISIKEVKEKEAEPFIEPDLCPNLACREPITEEGQKSCSKCRQRLERCSKCNKYTDIWKDKCIFCKYPIDENNRNWNQFKGDPARTGSTTEEIRLPLVRAWSYPESRNKKAPILSSPIVYKGSVCYGSGDMHLHAVNQYNGDALWTKPTKGVITSTPAIYKGILYTASGDGRIYAVEAKSGKPVWVYPDKGKSKDGAGKITSGILACEYGIITVNTSGEVLRLDPQTGRLIWRVFTDSDNLDAQDTDETAELTSTPALMGNKLYIATRGGRLYCLDIETGGEIWKFPSETPLPSRFVSTPALCGGICYIPDRSGKFYAISAATGEDTWTYTVDLESVVEGSPSICSGKIMTGTQDQWLVALSLHSGGELWREKNEKIRLIDSIFSTPTITKNGLVFYGSNSGYLYCRDINTGEELWNTRLDSPIRSAPAISDGCLYITTTGGQLYAFKQKE